MTQTYGVGRNGGIVPVVPELPCPKCGDPDTLMQYCDGRTTRVMDRVTAGPDDRCRAGDVEHLHRRCRRCEYRWRTDDVLNPRVVGVE